MGLSGIFSSAISAGFNISEARDIVKDGLSNALALMESMTNNEGQKTIYSNYVEPSFKENAQASIEDGWEDVDIGDYMDFMGDIVLEGNEIMAVAYEEAQQLLSELEAAAEELLSEE